VLQQFSKGKCRYGNVSVSRRSNVPVSQKPREMSHPFYALRLRLEFRGWLFLPFIGPLGFAEEGAIDPEGLAGNERGAGAGEKRDCGGDVGGGADSA